MLGKIVSDIQRDWDLHVPAAAATYRASEHVVEGLTPNFMMLRMELRALVDIILAAPAGEEGLWTSSHEFVAEPQQRYRKAYAIARENLIVPASRRKDDYDRKFMRWKFSIDK